MADLTQDEWVEQLENDSNAVILDVRTDDEVDQGFIPNAKHIDFYLGDEFVSQVDELDKSKNYYVYCRSGVRSGKACEIMDQLGFENSYNLLGGFMDWAGDVEER